MRKIEIKSFFFKVCSTTCHSKMDPDSINFKMLEYIYSFSVRKHQSTQLKPYAMWRSSSESNWNLHIGFRETWSVGDKHLVGESEHSDQVCLKVKSFFLTCH